MIMNYELANFLFVVTTPSKEKNVCKLSYFMYLKNSENKLYPVSSHRILHRKAINIYFNLQYTYLNISSDCLSYLNYNSSTYIFKKIQNSSYLNTFEKAV